MLCTFGILSCEDVRDDFDKFEQNYVAFSAEAANIQESQTVMSADNQPVSANSTYEVTVIRSSTDLSAPLTVGLSVNGVFAESSDFALEGDDASETFSLTEEISSLTIPAGKVSAKFLVITRDDSAPSGDKVLSFNITSVSDPSYQIGIGESKMKSSLSLTIVDDDCPIDLAAFEGEWEIVSFCGAPGARNEGFCRTNFAGVTVNLTADPSDPLGTTAIISGGIHTDDVVLKFVTCPKTVFIDAVYTLDFIQNGSTATIQPNGQPEVYGTGSYNEDSQRISIVFDYGNTGGSNFGAFVVEYKKK